jgi:hypothetical protein
MSLVVAMYSRLFTTGVSPSMPRFTGRRVCKAVAAEGLLKQLNERFAGANPGDTELETRLGAYEPAYTMQSSAPEVDLTKESERPESCAVSTTRPPRIARVALVPEGPVDAGGVVAPTSGAAEE